MIRNLDVILLAGGFAKRLEPISRFIPKPLLHVDGVPLINYTIEKILEIPHGKIIISVNSKFEKNFRHWLRTVQYENNLKIYLSVEPSKSEEEKLGAIGGLWYTIKTFNVDIDGSDVLVILGDNLFDFSLIQFVGYARRLDEIVIGVYDIKNIEEAKRYGVVTIDEDRRIIDFQEKPKDPKSTLISVGIYYFPNNKLYRIEEFLKENKKTDAIGSFFEWLIRREKVYAYIFQGEWFDIGTPESYIKANEWASEKNLGRKWLWP